MGGDTKAIAHKLHEATKSYQKMVYTCASMFVTVEAIAK